MLKMKKFLDGDVNISVAIALSLIWTGALLLLVAVALENLVTP